MSRQLRIAVVLFMHETVTMLPNDTTLQDFIYEGSPAGGDALLAAYPRDYMGGFVQFIREHQGVTLVGIESPLFPKTGTGSGWVTAEAFDTFTARMVELLVADGPFDGVYLCLHGAMAVRGTPRPEAELARRVRAAVGPKAMIVAHLRPARQRGRSILRARRHGVHRKILSALRHAPAGRTRRAIPVACLA